MSGIGNAFQTESREETISKGKKGSPINVGGLILGGSHMSLDVLGLGRQMWFYMLPLWDSSCVTLGKLFDFPQRLHSFFCKMEAKKST